MESVTRKTGWAPEGEDISAAAEELSTDDSDRSTIELLKLLIADGRDYAETEMERQKLRARIIGGAARDAAILGAVALFLLMGGLVALLIGGIWALAPHIGPIAATCLVLALCFGTVLLLALVARARVKTALRHITAGRETGS